MRVVAVILLTTPLLGCVGNWSSKSDAGSAAELGSEDASDESNAEPSVRPMEAADAATALGRPTSADAAATASDLDSALGDAATAEAPSSDAGRDDDASDGAADLDGSGSQDAAALQDAAASRDDAAAPEPTEAIAAVGSACTTPAALACLGHNVVQKLACLGQVWTFNGSCDGPTRCDSRLGVTQGTCQQILSTCLGKQPGAAFCEGLQRKLCGPDLLTATSADCGEHAHCDTNTAGCACDRGYSRNGAGVCQDIVDCPVGACANGRCLDGVETYECACDSGFQPSSDKKSCVNIDDCKGNTCGPGGTCKDGINTYQCTCAAGYEPNASGKMCINPNNCPAVDPCMPGGICVDGLNNYSCQCAGNGWYPGPSGKTCEFDPCWGGGCGGY